jgi:hypothetical protein
MCTCLNLDWNAVSAVANCVMAIGVLLAFWQLKITKRVAQLQFEDSLAKEYRDLAARIPTKAFYGVNLTEMEFLQAEDELYRYIDLCNEQVLLRIRGRISGSVWKDWCEGIDYNLRLPSFKRAWVEVKARTESFAELRCLETCGFKSDPRYWKTPCQFFREEQSK